MAHLRCDSINFCSSFEKFAAKNDSTKGLGVMQFLDIETGSVANLPSVKYGAKQSEKILINFCPFCGNSFEPRREFFKKKA